MAQNPRCYGRLQNNTQSIKGESKIAGMTVVSATPPVKVAVPSGIPATVMELNAQTPKPLPNIQPRTTSQIQPSRQLMPKAGGGITIATAATASVPQASATQQVIIPQGIQHVLINNQLYPIIQTANGTHLLIQQPVAQIQTNAQPSGKQVLTAQPISLGTAPAVSQPVLAAAQTEAPTVQPNNSTSQTTPNTAHNNDMNYRPNTNAMKTETAAASTPSVTPSKFANNQALPVRSQPSMLNLNTTPITVSAQTQAMLTKIQSQINLLKTRPNLDEAQKTNLTQLIQMQGQIMNDLRAQMQQYQSQRNQAAASAAANQQSAGSQSSTAPNQANIPTTVNGGLPYIQPNRHGNPAINQHNMMQLVAAFSNVKVGGQIYNIQLTEDQKKIMIEQMMGMPQAEQQRYIVEQQSQILATAFKSQNAQTDQSQSEVPSPKPPRHKYGGRGRGKRPRPASPTPVSSAASESSSSPTQSPSPIPSAGRGKSLRGRGRKSRPHVPLPKGTDKLAYQLQRDKELLLRGLYTKPFSSKVDACQGPLRYHLYYNKERHNRTTVADDNLLDVIAHELIAKKMLMEDKLRNALWSSSMTASLTGEDRLISQLLLEDEQNAMDMDKSLAANDIEFFKSLYTKTGSTPEQTPLQSPSPSHDDVATAPHPTLSSAPPSPSTEASIHSSPAKEFSPPKQRKRAPPKDRKIPPLRGRRRGRGRGGINRKSPTDRPTYLSEECLQEETNLSSQYTLVHDQADNYTPPASLPPVESTQLDAHSLSNQSLTAASSNPDDSSQSDDSEDCIVDIGEPPTPPMFTNGISNDSNNSSSSSGSSDESSDDTDSDQISSPSDRTPNLTFQLPPPRAGFTSSPQKHFEICSETVVQQSEEMDGNFRKMHRAEVSVSDQNEGEVTNDVSMEHEQYDSDREFDRNSSEIMYNYGESPKRGESYLTADNTDSDGEEALVEDVEVDAGSERSWGSSDSALEEDNSRVIAPIRIKKQQWDHCLEEKSSAQESPGPAIKLRFRRDQDKWEASSVSSYGDGSDASSEDEEESYREQRQVNNSEPEVSESGEDESNSNGGHVPFTHYDGAQVGSPHYEDNTESDSDS